VNVRAPCNLNLRQTLAALATTVAEHAAAAFGAFPGEETAAALTTDFRWLIRSFHVTIFLKRSVILAIFGGLSTPAAGDFLTGRIWALPL